MDVLTQLLSLSNIILALAVVAFVWVQRKGLELTFPKLKEKRAWKEFFVPIAPLGTGALVMLLPFVPVPEMFAGGPPAKMIFGVAMGLISGLLYRLIKKNLLERIGKDETKSPYQI